MSNAGRPESFHVSNSSHRLSMSSAPLKHLKAFENAGRTESEADDCLPDSLAKLTEV